MTYLVTGTAGFIGFHVASRLLREGHTVIGFDSVNDYYRVDLKEARLASLNALAEGLPAAAGEPRWKFYRGNLEDSGLVSAVFSSHRFDSVIHLAAQAGVRYSITNPRAYAASNLDGFLNVLEECRNHKIPHLAYASSSSVYGLNSKVPFSETDPVDHPVSLYAATKRANELMAHTYAHLYGLPVTGMRFFTVYGPWGRPDMAYFKFAEAITSGREIEIYNHGDLMRDFTYIDDVVKAVIMIADRPALPSAASGTGSPVSPDRSTAPYRVYNIGNSDPVRLDAFISTLEGLLGVEAKKKFLPMQAGDVYMTAADTSSLECDFGWKPSTPLSEGLREFTQWYKEKKLWQQSL